MKAHLLYPERDFEVEDGERARCDELVRDLDVTTLLSAMADGDRFIFDVSRTVLLTALDDPDDVRFRQRVLADCLDHPDVVRQLYAISEEAIEGERRVWGGWPTNRAETLLHRSVDVMKFFMGLIRRLRQLADEHGASFDSEGFTSFFEMISTELDDAYLVEIDEHLRRLRGDGIVVTAGLGDGNRGIGYVLRCRVSKRTWRDRFGLPDRPSYDYQIPERDQSGFEALSEMKGRGTAIAANTLAQSTDHVLAFFDLLRFELGFYIGCLNLHDRLHAKGERTCTPEPAPAGRDILVARGLYDACLSLRLVGRVVGNDVVADDKSVVMITGANRGGKSTLLRALGQAQLMLQAGMFVAADAFRADLRRGVFTHFKREEDASLRSGKLDEELGRMSAIIEDLTPGGLVLLNESFASTNEREGSDIAGQIVRALLESGVKVLYVTHQFELAHRFYTERQADALVLRAERGPDGERTFRLIEAEPLPTAYGADVFRGVFGRPLRGVPSDGVVLVAGAADDVTLAAPTVGSA